MYKYGLLFNHSCTSSKSSIFESLLWVECYFLLTLTLWAWEVRKTPCTWHICQWSNEKMLIPKVILYILWEVLVISFWSFHAMLCLISAWPVTHLSTAPRPKLRHTWPTSPLLTDLTTIKGKTRSRRHTALSHDFLFQSSSSLFGESYSLATHQKLIAGALI